HLRSIGFGVRATEGRFALDELLVVGLVAWVIILFGFICIPGVRTSTSIDELVARTLMIAVIYSVGVGCAIYERDHRPHELPHARSRRIARSLPAAIAASACGLAISFLFHAAIFRDVSRGLERLTVVYPWFVLTFLITFMTAVCLDNTAPPARRARLRAIEGSAMALVMLLAACGVRGWLSELAIRGHVADYNVPPLLGVMLISTGVGLFIGSFVPTWYREAPRSPRGEDELQDGPVTNVIPLPPPDGGGAAALPGGAGGRVAAVSGG